jgi:RNA polymerase primary sigma factor
MAKYRIDSIANLARQMAFTPAHSRVSQVENAESLLNDIQPATVYPVDFVVFRITGYRPKAGTDGELLTGLALQHDLGLLIEQVSEGLDFAAAAMAEPVLSIGDVTDRFDVTSKTIQRWRRRGLPARRFRFPDGKRRVGFLLSNVERFVSASCDRADAGQQKSVVESELEIIVRHARRLSGRFCPQTTAWRIARRIGRTPMTVLHTLRQYSTGQDNAGVTGVSSPGVSSPGVSSPDEDQRQRVIDAFKQLSRVKPISAATGLCPADVYRIVLEDRADRLSRRRMRFIDDPLYHGADADSAIADILSQPELSAEPVDGRVPRDLPAYLRDLYRVALLTPARERALFLAFNFRKCRFVTARREIDLSVARIRDVRRLESLLARATAVKNEIVRANLRLVVSVARRHVRPAIGLMDLVSEGNLTLMRAVEGFDLHKGFRFSTYATLALMKGFAAAVPGMRPSGSRAATGQLESVADPRDGDLIERRLDRDHLFQLLGRLDDREQRVLRAHYGIGTEPAATLEQVGRQLGLSKQRVRQIELAAIAKLRQ